MPPKPERRPQRKKKATTQKSAAPTHLDRARAICLALPETTEKIAWGGPTFRVKKKIFAMFTDNHHGDGRIALWMAAPKGAQVALVMSEPERFFVPPYVGKQGWIGVHLDKNSDARVASLVREAWLEIAPPKLHALVEGEPPRA
jgi:hypothetical protein